MLLTHSYGNDFYMDIGDVWRAAVVAASQDMLCQNYEMLGEL